MINNELTQPIIHSIARILQVLHFDFDKFTEALRKEYVNGVYSDCQHIYETALLCGIDRRTASAIIKGRAMPCKRSILLVIVEEVQKYLEGKNSERSRFNLEPDMTMAKYGNFSIDGVLKTKANGATTTASVLNSLKKIGIIKDMGPRFIFLGYPTPQAAALDKVTNVFSKQLDALVDDYLQQMQLASKHDQRDNGNDHGI